MKVVSAGSTMAVVLIVGVLMALPPTGVGAIPAGNSEACPLCIADLAIYDPPFEDDGVWEEEVTAIRTLANAAGWSTRSVSSWDINMGALGSGSQRRFRALVAPGGYAPVRLANVNGYGDDQIRDFVSSGGGFIGFCAGAYWGSDTVSFAAEANGRLGTQNKAGDYVAFDYDLGLFPGTAKGPFGWWSWSGGSKLNYQPTKITARGTDLASVALPTKARMVYGGGPFFVDGAGVPGYQVWARAVAPRSAPKGGPKGGPTGSPLGRNQPTIIKFNHGLGNVILFAYHPAILVNSNADGVELRQHYQESKIKWKRQGKSFASINHTSRVLVDASLRIAMRGVAR